VSKYFFYLLLLLFRLQAISTQFSCLRLLNFKMHKK